MVGTGLFHVSGLDCLSGLSFNTFINRCAVFIPIPETLDNSTSETVQAKGIRLKYLYIALAVVGPMFGNDCKIWMANDSLLVRPQLSLD